MHLPIPVCLLVCQNVFLLDVFNFKSCDEGKVDISYYTLFV